MKPREWVQEDLVFCVSSEQLSDGLRLDSLGQHHHISISTISITQNKLTMQTS